VDGIEGVFVFDAVVVVDVVVDLLDIVVMVIGGV
jgi:hypothetical protein